MENEESLLSVLSNTGIENLLMPQEALTIQAKLLDILAGRVDSYQRGGSSSVRIETAQELLRSAGFVISHGLRRSLDASGQAADSQSNKDSNAISEAVKARLLGEDYDTLFRAGLKAVEALVKEGEALLKTAVGTATAVENVAYHNTLKELGVFFKRYHYHHFAHEIPCMLDYPLAHPVDEALLGIDYINEYLRRLIIENEFCGKFNPETVTALLKSIVPDYEENLLSIYEAVAANALALTLLAGDVAVLDVTDRERERLISLIGAWTEETAPTELMDLSSGLCAILDISESRAADYLERTASELYIRIKPILRYGRLEQVFPSLYREKPVKKAAVTYIDGPLMDNERLRALIDALTSCRSLSDKISLVRHHVGSLRDWAEILGICFWGDELQALFMTFSDDERDLLLRYVREKQRKYPEWISETGWEDALIDFSGEKGCK
jgi:hypothetical protein